MIRAAHKKARLREAEPDIYLCMHGNMLSKSIERACMHESRTSSTREQRDNGEDEEDRDRKGSGVCSRMRSRTTAVAGGKGEERAKWETEGSVRRETPKSSKQQRKERNS